MPPHDYSSFLKSPSGKHWKRIGLRRRAGVAAPLFSIYSNKSVGIGELPDLKLLVNWAKSAGMSLIQLLPMNDTGFNFRPYDSESSFALEPMYLSLNHLIGADTYVFKKEIAALAQAFPTGRRVNYQIKRAKLDLLWKIFLKAKARRAPGFDKFRRAHAPWVGPYALFKVIKAREADKGWQDWPENLKMRQENSLGSLEREAAEEILFHQWLQWQLFHQFRRVREYARKNGVLLMGDLPFLVARDSADAWWNPHFFKLNVSAGAPPDKCFPGGQQWGMPSYHWDNISRDGYRCLIRRLRYAENFYDLYRVDHFVGLFRLWTFRLDEKTPAGGFAAAFDPADESSWEFHGKSILEAMLKATRMMPCAEDLGTVPACSYRVLKEFALPGLDIQRWTRDWEGTGEFKEPPDYRPNSIAAISTHDLPALAGWWEHEVGAEEKKLFWRYLGLSGRPHEKCARSFALAALQKINEAASIFSVQLLQDWLAPAGLTRGDSREFRINFPGTTSDRNWSMVMPISLEKMKRLPLNRTLRSLNRQTGRM